MANLNNLDSSILQAILNHSNKYIVALDCNFKYIAFNQACADEYTRVYGKQLAIGMTLHDALAHLPMEHAKAIQIWQRAFQGETFTIIKQFGNKILEQNYYEIYYSPIYDEQKNLIGALQIASDLTQTKRTEENIKTLTNQLSLTLEAAEIGTWHWDISSNKVTSDTRHKQLFNLKELPEPIAEDIFARIHPTDRQRVVQELNHSILEKSFFESEFRLLLPDQSIRWLGGLGEVYCDAEGNPSYMLGVNWDITEKKQIDLRLHDQQQQLANIAKLLCISETASILAHEINQPLAAIATYSQLCSAQFENNKVDQQELLNYIRQITKQSLRAGEIIHSLKELTQHKSLCYELTSVNDLITETIEYINYLKKTHPFNITLNFSDNLPSIKLDKVQLQQIIINIMVNALEAMQSNGMQDNQIIITTQLAHNTVEIYIKNNGPPIAKALHKKIFAPYFTTKSYGMGIGLSMCRTILEAHRGDLILVYSSKKKGTCFKLSLPVN